MFKHIKWLMLMLLIFINLQQALTAQENDSVQFHISFEEALAKTSVNNQIIRQSQALVEQKQYELKASRSHYYPKVSLNANYAYMSEDITMDLSPVRDAITPLYEALGNYGNFSGVPNPDPTTSSAMPILPDNVSTAVVRNELKNGLETINAADWNQMIQKQQFGTVSASFVQPIYTGGKIILANQAAHIRLDEAQLQQSDKYAQVYTELVERYFALVLSKKVTEVRKQVYQTIEAHYSDAGKLKEQGIIANSEYLHARVYLSDADREFKKAVRQEEIVNQGLLNTLSIDSIISIQPISGLFYLQKLEPLDYYLMLASENSPLLKQVDKKIQLAQTAYKSEVSEYLPNIAAMGTYDIANKDLSPYIPDYIVGVGLKWSLSEGASRPNKVKAARFQMQQAEIYSDKASADIHTVIAKQYQELNMCLEQLVEIENAMQFANEYYRVTEKGFAEGISTTTELADARLVLAKVKIEKFSTVYQFDVALSRLLYYVGNPDYFNLYQKSTYAVYVND